MTFNINKYKIQNKFWKIIIYQSFINKLSSVQADFSTKHTARVKPLQYIAQHLYEQKSKSNCSSYSSHTSYKNHSKSPEKKTPSIEKSLVVSTYLPI